MQEVGLALKAHQVVGAQAAHQPLGLRNGGQQERRRHGDVQKKPNALRTPQGAQFQCQGNEVVVVHPNDVVWPEQGLELARKQLVHAPVAAHVAGVQVGQVQPVMEHRPEHAVAVAQVVAVVVVLRQIHGGQGHGAGLLHMQLIGLAGLGNVAAPAKPQPALGL